MVRPNNKGLQGMVVKPRQAVHNKANLWSCGWENDLSEILTDFGNYCVGFKWKKLIFVHWNSPHFWAKTQIPHNISMAYIPIFSSLDPHFANQKTP